MRSLLMAFFQDDQDVYRYLGKIFELAVEDEQLRSRVGSLTIRNTYKIGRAHV